MSICDLNLSAAESASCHVDWKNNIKLEIDRLIFLFPEIKKSLLTLLQDTDIREVTFAGRGSFDDKGRFYDKEDKEGFKYMIRYHHGPYRNLVYLFGKSDKYGEITMEY